jgi:hypothetical protein
MKHKEKNKKEMPGNQKEQKGVREDQDIKERNEYEEY